jgi:hypothetical protein
LFSHSLRARTILLALILCLAAAVGAQARGRAERESRQRLGEVEQLIEEKRYNEAVRLLSEVVQEDPDRFDAAEELMEKIRARRAEIDQNFAELNEAIRQNEEEKIVALVDTIEKLNPYPSKAEEDLLDMLRAAGIERIYFVNLFRDLMARARAQIQAGEYRQAVSIYLEVFGEDFRIVRENFDAEEYGNILKNSVESALGNLQNAIVSYDALTDTLERSTENFGAEPGNLPSEVEAAAGLLQSMAAELETVKSSGQTFQTQNERVRESSARGEYDLFLFFADQVVFGPEEEGAEGIAAALDSFWRSELDDLQSALLGPGQEAYETAVQRFRAQSLEAALASVERAQALFPSLLELQALWPLRVEPTLAFPTGERGRSAFTAALPGFLRTQEYLKALAAYRTLIQASRRVDELTVKELVSAEQIYDDRDELGTLLQDAGALAAAWNEQLRSYRQGAELGLAMDGHASQAGEVLSDISAAQVGIQELDARLLYRLTLLQGAEFEQRFRDYEDRFEEAVKFQDGEEVPTETGTRLAKYPARARDIYLSLQDNLGELDQGVGALLADVLNKAEEDPQNIELKKSIDSLRSLDERITDRQTELEPRLEDAEQAALLAERYKREGLQRYVDAQADVRNGRYDSARENIEIASERFDTSLGYQEDAEVRQIRSEELVRLSKQISDQLLDLVVTEVRRKIEEGRRSYAQGDFAGAEQTFRAAQDDWLKAFATENDEVNFWLGLVQSAVDATTGRTIAETDPLYKEMSQLYNLALEDFNTGKQLVAQDRVGEAREALDRAESRLLKILFPFPFNAKARVLTLRILQLRDPEAFSSRITNLYNEALRRREESPQEAYATLKDIEQILPNYPGLQNAIANLEVALGFRIPPPDPAKIARSRDLYLEAQSIWDRQQRFLFEDALNNLNQAISLNPDNRPAVILKDQLLRAMGGGVTILLSPEDQRLLQQAQQLYVARRYFEALQLVEQLLEKPANRTNTEILELEKRLRARTGT